MNCKPGDLAIVLRDYSGLHEGRIVRCVRAYSFYKGLPHWHTDPVLRDPDGMKVSPYDGHLLPIRDPGEDARDETLNWLPVPTKEHA